MLEDINILVRKHYLKHKEFNTKTHFMSNLLMQFMQGEKIGEFKSITLEIIPDDIPIEDRYDDIGDRLVWFCRFDFIKFWKKQSNEQKQLLFDFSCLELDKLFNHFKWESKSISEAKRELKNSELISQIIIGDPVKSKNNEYYAELSYFHDMDKIQLIITIYDSKNDVLCMSQIKELEPCKYFLDPYIGNFFWEDELVLILEPKSEKLESIAVQLSPDQKKIKLYRPDE